MDIWSILAPFALNGGDILKGWKWDRDRIIKGVMGTKEVIVSYKQGSEGYCSIVEIETVCSSGVELIGAIESFDKLLKIAILFGFGVEVLESYDLFMSKGR